MQPLFSDVTVKSEEAFLPKVTPPQSIPALTQSQLLLAPPRPPSVPIVIHQPGGKLFQSPPPVVRVGGPVLSGTEQTEVPTQTVTQQVPLSLQQAVGEQSLPQQGMSYLQQTAATVAGLYTMTSHGTALVAQHSVPVVQQSVPQGVVLEQSGGTDGVYTMGTQDQVQNLHEFRWEGSVDHTNEAGCGSSGSPQQTVSVSRVADVTTETGRMAARVELSAQQGRCIETKVSHRSIGFVFQDSITNKCS